MQNLAWLDERLGLVAAEQLDEAGDQITRNLDTDPNSITVANGGKRLLNLPTEMKGDSICSLGRVQRPSRPERIFNWCEPVCAAPR